MSHSIYSVDRYNCSRKLFITTNTACNLNCLYCYESNKGNKTINVDETLEKVLPILQKKTELGTIIKLLGGEPFLVFDKIKMLCEGIWDSNLPETVLIHTTTNGTLVHGETQEWLERNKHRLTVKLSIDGNREMQEINRPGSFDKIDIDFFVRNWPEMGIKMTISPRTIGKFSNGVIFLHERNIQRISTSFAELIDWSEPGLDRKFFIEMNKLYEFYKDHMDYNPCTFFEVPFRNIFNKIEIHHCTIGSSEVIDHNTGKCYPCIFFMPTVCGQEMSDKLMSLDLKTIESLDSSDCRNCPFVRICRTCYAANFMQRGASYRRDMAICRFHKIIFLFAAKYKYHKYVESNIALSRDFKDINVYEDLKAILQIMDELKSIENLYR